MCGHGIVQEAKSPVDRLRCGSYGVRFRSESSSLSSRVEHDSSGLSGLVLMIDAPSVVQERARFRRSAQGGPIDLFKPSSFLR